MKINVLSVVVLVILSLVCFCDCSKSIDDNDYLAEIVIKQKIDLNEEFDDDEVIVTLKSKYSTKNENFDIARFESENIAISSSKCESNKILIESMDDLFMIYDSCYSEKISHFNRIIKLNLAHHSKENVVKVCDELNKKDFVLFAEPNYAILSCNNSVNVSDEYYGEQ